MLDCNKKNLRPALKRTLSIVAALLVITSTSVAAGLRLSVETPVGNIRSGPGTNFDILWKVERYYPIHVLEKSGVWYQFTDYEGDRGWIHNSLLGETSSIITKNPKCNIRSGPGTRFDIRFSVGAGIPFKVIKKKGRWLRVEHADGDRGWIHNSLVW